MEVLADGESSSGRYSFQKVADGGVRVAEWSRWLDSGDVADQQMEQQAVSRSVLQLAWSG